VEYQKINPTDLLEPTPVFCIGEWLAAGLAMQLELVYDTNQFGSAVEEPNTELYHQNPQIPCSKILSTDDAEKHFPRKLPGSCSSPVCV
jgi:hypothetical protein